MRWVDGHKGVFSVELTAVSSVHPQVQGGMRSQAPWPVPLLLTLRLSKNYLQLAKVWPPATRRDFSPSDPDC